MSVGVVTVLSAMAVVAIMAVAGCRLGPSDNTVCEVRDWAKDCHEVPPESYVPGGAGSGAATGSADTSAEPERLR